MQQSEHYTSTVQVSLCMCLQKRGITTIKPSYPIGFLTSYYPKNSVPTFGEFVPRLGILGCFGEIFGEQEDFREI